MPAFRVTVTRAFMGISDSNSAKKFSFDVTISGDSLVDGKPFGNLVSRIPQTESGKVRHWGQSTGKTGVAINFLQEQRHAERW